MELIDLRTGSSTHELRGHKSSILTCNWSPTEEYLLATGGIDQCIYLWDIRASNSCLKALDQSNRNDNKGTAHSGYVNGLKFTEDGYLLVSVGTDNKIRLWETLSGSNKKKDYIEIKNDVKKNIQFAISDNTKSPILYVPSEGNIFVINMYSGSLINVLNGHFHLVNCCFYRNTFQELYSGGNDRNILLWTADEPHEEKWNEKKQLEKTFLVKHTFLQKNNAKDAEDAWSSDEE